MFGGLLHRTIVSALLVVIGLGLNVAITLPKGTAASQNLPMPELAQNSDSVLQISQQPDQRSSLAVSDKLTLTDGTPVRFRFVRAVISSRVIAGEKVPLEVVEPVLAGNLIAIPQRASAEATVTLAQAGRSMGRGGNLELKIEGVRLSDGQLIPVRAVKRVKAGGKRQPLILAGAAAGMAYWPASPLGFLIYVKGKNATIPVGTEIIAYINGGFPLDASKFQTAQQKDAPK